jgi:hypothetical protein
MLEPMTTETTHGTVHDHRAETRFPGRWVEGAGLVLGPVLLLSGLLLRMGFGDSFQDQLAAFDAQPGRMTVSYSLFAAGNVLMWPAVIALTRRIAVHQPRWALWGGALAILGLFARAFHAGVSHLGFRLVEMQGLDSATATVAGSYGAFHVFHYANVAILSGWIVLAVGAFRSGALGAEGVERAVRCVALGLMAALPLGVLKGTGPMSILATLGLCVALLPFGISVLREGPSPTSKEITLFLALVAMGLFLGTVG